MLVNGFMYIVKEIAKRAEDELYDEEGVRDELVAIYRALESGAMTEEEFQVKETELLERLEVIEQRQRRLGHRNAAA
jgi:Gas vesicle protein G